jgi:MFS family permease
LKTNRQVANVKTKEFLAYKFCKETVPIYPVYLLLFTSKGLDLGQISLLFAIWSLPVVLFEVPTGILADHWSRKNMIVLGSLCKMLCFVSWFFADGFVLFAVGFLLWGLGEALTSGSEEALLFDNLKLRDAEHMFEKVYGKGTFYAGLGVALSCFTGGFLAELITFKGVLLISVGSVLLSSIVASRFQEVNYFKVIKTSGPETDRERPWTTLKDSLELCFTNKLLFIVILLLVCVVGVAGILDEYDPLVADSYGFGLGMIGIWIGVRYLLEALGSRLAYRIQALLKHFGITKTVSVVVFLCVVAGVGLGIFSGLQKIYLLPLYWLFYLLLAAAAILQEAYVQKQVDQQGRSTVHSIISLVYNLYGLIFMLGIYAISGLGIHTILLLVSVYIIILSMLLWIRHAKLNK